MEYYPYTLGEREGALIRIDGGHADCHPWPELGDLPLEQQLKKLAFGETTPLTERSFSFAKLDREARRERRSLFEGLMIPKSHHLLLNVSDPFSNASIVKIKVKKTTPTESLKTLIEKHGCRIRLDFNAQLEIEEFESFLKEMKPYLSSIDFIEDPFPYHREKWQSMQEKYGVALACDRNSKQAIGHIESAKVLVIKPAVQDSAPFQNALQRIVVTSYLDHPFGQLTAAFVAAQMTTEVCGLHSHHVYQTNEFSERFGEELTPFGTGFGFDDLLERLPWKKI